MLKKIENSKILNNYNQLLIKIFYRVIIIQMMELEIYIKFQLNNKKAIKKKLKKLQKWLTKISI